MNGKQIKKPPLMKDIISIRPETKNLTRKEVRAKLIHFQ
jgi:hypothetical protein